MADLHLKRWGVKDIAVDRPEIREIHDRYEALRVRVGPHGASTKLRDILYELIDAVDAYGGTIVDDWTGEPLTKDEAKRFVRNAGMGSGQDGTDHPSPGSSGRTVH